MSTLPCCESEFYTKVIEILSPSRLICSTWTTASQLVHFYLLACLLNFLSVLLVLGQLGKSLKALLPITGSFIHPFLVW